MEIERSDRAAVDQPADHEQPAVAAVVVEQVLEPALLHREADRAAQVEVAGRALVGEPADEGRDVRPLGRPEVHEPAAVHRNGGVGLLGGHLAQSIAASGRLGGRQGGAGRRDPGPTASGSTPSSSAPNASSMNSDGASGS